MPADTSIFLLLGLVSFWEELQAKLYLHCLLNLALTVVTPPWRSVGTDLSAVITWVGLGLSAAEPHAHESLYTHMSIRLRETVNEFRSIERDGFVVVVCLFILYSLLLEYDRT